MIQTNWMVISGPPSSGKTTLINQLQILDYTVASEVARQVIVDWMIEHQPEADFKTEASEIQRRILALNLLRERGFNPQDLVFFDRGIPDSIGYFKHHHLNLKDALRACRHWRYHTVFFCAELPVEQDGVRIEDDLEASELNELIYQAYCSQGYEPIILPKVSVEARMEIILQHVRACGF